MDGGFASLSGPPRRVRASVTWSGRRDLSYYRCAAKLTDGHSPCANPLDGNWYARQTIELANFFRDPPGALCIMETVSIWWYRRSKRFFAIGNEEAKAATKRPSCLKDREEKGLAGSPAGRVTLTGCVFGYSHIKISPGGLGRRSRDVS